METTSNRLEPAVVSRLMWRLMPFLFLLYIIAYLDRINMSFAVLQMRGQLGLSERAMAAPAESSLSAISFSSSPAIWCWRNSESADGFPP